MNFSPIVKNREYIKSLSPAMRYNLGENFVAWQTAARAQLVELLGLNTMQLVDDGFTVIKDEVVGGQKQFTFKLQTEKDYFLTCTLRLPALDEKDVPLVVCPCGSSDDLAAMLSLEKDSDLAVAAAFNAAGYAVLIVEQRSFDDCFAMHNVMPEETATRTTWCACYRSSMRAAMLGRSTMGERVWDMMRVIDATLENFAAISRNDIYLVGTSGGATLAYYTAAVDTRVCGVVSSCGFGSYEKSIMMMNHCVCNYIPQVVNYFEMGDIAGLIAPRKLTVIAANEDQWFTPECVRDAFDLAKSVYDATDASDAVKLCMTTGDRGLHLDLALDALVSMTK